MSEHRPTLDTYDDEVADEPTALAGSLEERVAARRRQLEERTTELFDLPGFEGICQVEMRVVGAKRQLAIMNEHQRIHDESKKVVRVACDLILAATVQFHSIVDDEGTTKLAEGVSWKSMAQAYDKTLDNTVRGRQALVRLLTENGVLDLLADWREWMRTRGVKVAEELKTDF